MASGRSKYQLDILRRIAPAIPIKPVPSSAWLDGSGLGRRRELQVVHADGRRPILTFSFGNDTSLNYECIIGDEPYQDPLNTSCASPVRPVRSPLLLVADRVGTRYGVAWRNLC